MSGQDTSYNLGTNTANNTTLESAVIGTGKSTVPLAVGTTINGGDLQAYKDHGYDVSALQGAHVVQDAVNGDRYYNADGSPLDISGFNTFMGKIKKSDQQHQEYLDATADKPGRQATILTPQEAQTKTVLGVLNGNKTLIGGL